MTPTLLWFRQDLRLQDNPALQAAIARGASIVPVYVWDEAGEGAWPGGGATRWWLHHSLTALEETLRARGSRLVLAQGESAAVVANPEPGRGIGTAVTSRRRSAGTPRSKRSSWSKASR